MRNAYMAVDPLGPHLLGEGAKISNGLKKRENEALETSFPQLEMLSKSAEPL